MWIYVVFRYCTVVTIICMYFTLVPFLPVVLPLTTSTTTLVSRPPPPQQQQMRRRFGNNYSNLISLNFDFVNRIGKRLVSVTKYNMDRCTVADVTTPATMTKDIWIIRHGQAVHNPRAEYARDVLQCSHDEFLSIMEEDDCFDAPLTTLGIQQAQQIYSQYGASKWYGLGTTTPPIMHTTVGREEHHPSKSSSSSSILEPHQPKRHPVELVVSSPLSRALHTAELAMGVDTDDRKFQSTTTMTTTTTTSTTNRVCYEGFREINGWLQNGKRHTKMELELKFPSWDFSLLSSNDDVQWTPTLETTDSCMERGYEGLLWIMKDRPERSIVLVSHGALLKYTLTDHPNVILQDGRKPITTVRPPHCIVPDDTDGNSHSEAVTSTTLEPQQSSSPTEHRCVRQRYHNCEIRRYRMELLSSNKSRECIDENHVPSDSGNMKDHLQQRRDVIILTEVDL